LKASPPPSATSGQQQQQATTSRFFQAPTPEPEPEPEPEPSAPEKESRPSSLLDMQESAQPGQVKFGMSWMYGR
jgi:hypothetical protein